MARMIRGVEERFEQKTQNLLRDTRTTSQRMHDFITEPHSCGIFIMILGAIAFLMPAISDLALIAALICFIISSMASQQLPFRMPQRANSPDPNDLNPGNNKPLMARGIAFFGNQISDNEELWFNNDDMRTHVLIFGSTGSGKTEALVSIAFNALIQGSGFIYVDGKGDNSLYAKLFSMTRKMGREDDLLLINFMTGARDVMGPQKTRLSNTMNPFSTGSSSMLANLIVSLMPSSKGGGDGDMWKGRAITFVEALMMILVYMRDRGELLLDANSIRNYFHLEKLETISIDKQFPFHDGRKMSLEAIPSHILEPIDNYLATLPGFRRQNKGKQTSEVYEQHGFITMQLTRVFTSLADTYGHIIRTNLGEVDFHDVVLNRRILVVLLPALEKSPDELANLGKVIVSSLKAMMASGLGDEVEGTRRKVIERKPTNSPTPFMCILDEYGYYSVEGFAVVPAQARSLGFSAIFAGQDLPAFQKASKEEAASIGANTNIKIAMKLEDPTETWEFFQKTAGETFVTQTSGFQTQADSMTNSYGDNRGAQVEKRGRIDLLDLKDQRPGEAHVFFASKIVRARMFYANPKPVKVMQVNHFLKVVAPDGDESRHLIAQLDLQQKFIKQKEPWSSINLAGEEINFMKQAWQASVGKDMAAAAFSIINQYHELLNPQSDSSSTSNQVIASEKRMIPAGNHIFSQNSNDQAAILDYDITFEGLIDISRLTGHDKKQAEQIAQKMIALLISNTSYPSTKDILEKPSSTLFLSYLTTLEQHLIGQDAS